MTIVRRNINNVSLYLDFRQKHIADMSMNRHVASFAGTATLNKNFLQCVSSTGYLSIPNADSLKLDVDTTMVFLLEPAIFMNTTLQVFYYKGDSAGTTSQEIYFYYNGTSQNLTVYTQGGSQSTLAYTLANIYGKRYFAVNLDIGAKPTFYVDGVNVGQGNNNFTPLVSTQNCRIGNDPFGDYVKGSFDAVIMFRDKLLSDAEHMELHTTLLQQDNIYSHNSFQSTKVESSLYAKREDSLICKFQMKANGNIIVDQSKNNFNATSVGTPVFNVDMDGHHLYNQDGASNYMQVAHDAIFNKGIGEYEWEFSWKPLSTNQYSDIIGKRLSGSPYTGWTFSQSGALGGGTGNKFTCAFIQNVTNSVDNGYLGVTFNDVFLSSNILYRLKVTLNSATRVCRLWCNDIEITSYTLDPLGSGTLNMDNNAVLQIGGNPAGGGAELKGKLYNFSMRSKITDCCILDNTRVFKTDFGAVQTAVNNNTANTYLSNLPIRIGSGEFKVATDYIKGTLVKTIECVTAGSLYMNRITELGGEGQSTMANGSLSFWVNKADTTNFQAIFFGDVIGAKNATGQDGYYIDIATDEIVACGESVNGTATDKFTIASGVTAGTWNKLKISRTFQSVFNFHINDVYQNTFTDSTRTFGSYMNFVMGVGDKISISDVQGNYSIVKDWYKF